MFLYVFLRVATVLAFDISSRDVPPRIALWLLVGVFLWRVRRSVCPSVLAFDVSSRDVPPLIALWLLVGVFPWRVRRSVCPSVPQRRCQLLQLSRQFVAMFFCVVAAAWDIRSSVARAS